MGEIDNIPGPALVIPVFPLPNVVLFPKVELPLHIFEPRYRQMVRDAMPHQQLIGMALLKGNWEKEYYGNPEMYPVGCLGRIVGATALPDGRYNILLLGLREYLIQEHISGKTLYRQARVLLRDRPEEMQPASLTSIKNQVLELAQRTMAPEAAELINTVSDPTIDGETWLNLCCFSLDISALERQTLLEAKSLQERAAHLLNVLRFKAAEKKSPLGAADGSNAGKLPH